MIGNFKVGCGQSHDRDCSSAYQKVVSVRVVSLCAVNQQGSKLGWLSRLAVIALNQLWPSIMLTV